MQQLAESRCCQQQAVTPGREPEAAAALLMTPARADSVRQMLLNSIATCSLAGVECTHKSSLHVAVAGIQSAPAFS